MPRNIAISLVGAVVWILWCIFAVTELVPNLRLYITVYSWFLAYVLCLTPVIISAFVIVMRSRRRA